MQSGTIVSSSTARQPPSALETARLRLIRAIDQHAHAERVEEAADTNVRRHGGPGRCSAAMMQRLVRAHLHTFTAGLDVKRFEGLLADAMVEDHTNGVGT
jgi:hypothetical protein